MSILEVHDVSIRYMTGDFKDIGLKEYVTRRLTGNYHVVEFWADHHITFSLEKGDMLGIIGTNGAGKSTLLKAISGIMEPTGGYVKREGNIAALLELASGFDGDLTVRENTYLRGAMLGYTRKFMDEKYPEIIEFAELQEFQDRPFKQLSSGMMSRLAFSVASLVHPDILILDEVLSVGDGAFRKKSEAKMREIISSGATTILVSHSIEQVREMCNKVLWIEKGNQIGFGDTDLLCDLYQKYLDGAISLEEARTKLESVYGVPESDEEVSSDPKDEATQGQKSSAKATLEPSVATPKRMLEEWGNDISSCLHISQLFLYTIAASILLSELVFIWGRAISWYIMPLGFLAGILCLALLYGDGQKRKMLGEVFVTILLFLVACVISGKFLDFSYDGNSYHKVAVGLLKNHWNPMLQTSANGMEELMGMPCAGSMWAECYAKGAWILGAGIYGLTGNIECGKAYTLISMVIAFLLTYYCVRRYSKGKLFSMAFAGAAAINPVAILQMTTFYVDGYLHMTLYILVLALSWLAREESDREERRIFGSIVACAVVICGTIKYTGLLYGGVYCIIFFLYYCYRQLRSKDSTCWKRIRDCFFRFAFLAGITVFWAGADCYVMNTVRYGAPLYPLYGKGNVDIMTENSAFGEVNRVKNLFISLFSKAGNPIRSLGAPPPELKAPFTVDWAVEKDIAGCTDCRISGFGVLFSGILIIAAVAIIVKLINTAKTEKGKGIPFWILLLGTNVGLCLAITESWWARYAPYIWFTALLGLFFALEWKSNVFGEWLKGVLCVIVLSNSLFCLWKTPDTLRQSDVIREEMYALRRNTFVEVDVGVFPGIYFNLLDQNVRVIPNETLKVTGVGEQTSYKGMVVLPHK